MLDIPEINELIIGQELSPHDLAQCALVSKKWNATVTPHLWRDLSFLRNGSEHQQNAFHRLVLEDYLQVQRLDQHPINTEQPESSSSLSTLARYGSLIQMLPDQVWNHFHFQGITTPSRLRQPIAGQDAARQDAARQDDTGPTPTPTQLFNHLYQRRCPTAQLNFFGASYQASDPGGWNKDVVLLVPRACRLLVETNYCGPHSEFSRLKNLLDHCSSTLEVLYLRVQIDRTNTLGEDDEERVEMESKDWTSLKTLSLQTCYDTTDSKAFWTWLWKRCYRIKRLEAPFIAGLVESLAQGIVAQMCDLVEISLGESTPWDEELLTDHNVATLLAGSQKGWKVVTIKETASFGSAAMDALKMHFSTLEEFLLSQREETQTAVNLAQVLSSCSSLNTFVDLDETTIVSRTHPHLEAKIFIDQDPVSGSLKAWSCEESLRVLKAKITKIPRPDLDDWTNKGSYPGQGREVQMLVYKRLARLTNLETLWLGKVHVAERHIRPRCLQIDCLEMSLESGLHRLSNLKKLKELSVECMKTRIGVKEVQWMVEHWPRLRVIHGLVEHGDDRDAVEWLREHYPRIHLAQTDS
ncbi:hypothetical protein B0O80DRAFT_454168 [Mortierella sp. GBAus27b]|nr:hypothetical protein BGX31_001740 [Mortierella sp. GBA43]KAI8352284.1 hypothetical protein B0O80DRAFT_454168 [Mortierella sp. GBAus27b]